tara:strand:- start:664 stop:1518 length:855 start_codon:yes stop_codon:yes gene_type:complete
MMTAISIKTTSVLGAVFLLLRLTVGAQTVGLEIAKNAEPVDQTSFSATACGPAAMLNALKFGSESHRTVYQKLTGAGDVAKLRFVIGRYFDQPSLIFEHQKRFTKAGGVAHSDLLAALRDCAEENRLPELQGTEWVRDQGTASVEFVRDTHRKLRFSLIQETLPILGLRSQIARYDSETASWNWRKMSDHFIVVTAVPDELREGAHGFSFDYVEPNGGKLASGFIHAERRQAFAGYQGTAAKGRWLDGNRFLLVTAPSSYSLINGDRAKWHDRTLITLSYIISL